MLARNQIRPQVKICLLPRSFLHFPVPHLPRLNRQPPEKQAFRGVCPHPNSQCDSLKTRSRRSILDFFIHTFKPELCRLTDVGNRLFVCVATRMTPWESGNLGAVSAAFVLIYDSLNSHCFTLRIFPLRRIVYQFPFRFVKKPARFLGQLGTVYSPGLGIVRRPSRRKASFFCSQTSSEVSFSSSRRVRS